MGPGRMSVEKKIVDIRGRLLPNFTRPTGDVFSKYVFRFI